MSFVDFPSFPLVCGRLEFATECRNNQSHNRADIPAKWKPTTTLFKRIHKFSEKGKLSFVLKSKKKDHKMIFKKKMKWRLHSASKKSQWIYGSNNCALVKVQHAKLFGLMFVKKLCCRELWRCVQKAHGSYHIITHYHSFATWTVYINTRLRFQYNYLIQKVIYAIYDWKSISHQITWLNCDCGRVKKTPPLLKDQFGCVRVCFFCQY